MVLTQQKDTAQYLASMEGAYRATEVQLFGNITNTCFARNAVSGYPTNTQYTNPNDSVSKVDYNGSSGQKTGPSLLLKVMSGDTIKIGVQSYYNSGSGTTNNSSFNDVLNSLANMVVNCTGGAHGSVANFTSNGSTMYSAVQNFPLTYNIYSEQCTSLACSILEDSGVPILQNTYIPNTRPVPGSYIPTALPSLWLTPTNFINALMAPINN